MSNLKNSLTVKKSLTLKIGVKQSKAKFFALKNFVSVHYFFNSQNFQIPFFKIFKSNRILKAEKFSSV